MAEAGAVPSAQRPVEDGPTGGSLAVGDRAPVVELPDTHGTPVPLGGRRERPQLVVFLPFAFSRVCGGELRDLAAAAVDGADVVAVTCDSVFALRAWGEQEDVGLPLLSDFWPHGRAARAFGALDETTGVPARVSVLLDDDGVVAWSVRTPAGVARSVSDYRAAVSGLTR